MNNRRLTIVKNEKKQVLIFPLRRYFLEATKERNRKKNVYIFFLTTKKTSHLKQGSKGKQVSKRKGEKRIERPYESKTGLYFLTYFK